MKKLYFFLIPALLLIACKKDSSGSNGQKQVLTRVYLKGLLNNEMIFSLEGNIIRRNYYTTGGGQSNLSTYQLFEYGTDGVLKQIFHMTSSNTPTVRRIYSYNNLGKLTRVDEATIFTGDDNLDNMDYFETYDYDNKGQVIKLTRRQTNFKLFSTTDYTYDDKGSLIIQKHYIYENNLPVLKENVEITPNDKQMPEYWKKLLLYPTDMNLYEFFITSKKVVSYYGNPAGDTSITSITERNYNNQGNPVKQTYKLEAFGSILTSERTFEYINTLP